MRVRLGGEKSIFFLKRMFKEFRIMEYYLAETITIGINNSLEFDVPAPKK